MRKCKICKVEFTPVHSSVQMCCSINCAIEYSKQIEKKKWTKQKKVLKEKLKTKSDYQKELQPIFNQIAREIDKSSLCLMCGKKPKKENGCHYHSVGSNPTLRWNLFNIWLGCEKCNSWLGGNINGYDNEIIKYYGRDKWEYIKFDLVRIYKSLHLSIPELKELKVLSKKILKEVKDLPVLTHNERWELRKKLNIRLNIYK